MIRYLHGELVSVDDGSVIIDVGGVGYEVMVPAPVADQLLARGIGSQVKVHTYHCERGGAAGAGAPMLVGFATELQRRFFEELLNVPQLGPVGACKAMTLPIGTIARAITLGDGPTLQKLPGVGKQRARDMISKLQERMAPYLEEDVAPVERPPMDELTAEAVAVLTQIGLSEPDARARVRAVREAAPDIDEADEIVRAVFRRK